MEAISVNTPEYINKLEFDYIETYSFQRGQEYEDDLITQQKYLDQLKDRKKNGAALTAQEEVRYQKLHALLNSTQYLVNSRNEFHPSGQNTATISGCIHRN